MRTVLLLSALLSGCAKHASAPPPPPPPPHAGYAFEPEPSEAALDSYARDLPKMASGRGSGSGPAAASPPSAAPAAPAPEAAAPATEPAESPDPPEPDRMVHYDGHARLRVTNPDETLDAVADLATAAGGRVERLAGRYVTVRVPVARFEEVLDQVLALGDVLDRSIRADDITEHYLAVDLRVRTLRATRDRLVDLLAKATEEEDKLALLREITRVTEELDAVEARLRTLADLASMSRITVQTVPREAFTARTGPELDGHEWIRELSPFDRSVHDRPGRVPLPVPAGLVMLDDEGPFIAESADGTVLWTLRVDNDPAGSADWWVTAIADRIGEEFANLDRRKVGSWACLALDEPGEDDPYRWDVCVRPAGRRLHVAQVFYPTPGHVERYAAGVDAALVTAGGGA